MSPLASWLVVTVLLAIIFYAAYIFHRKVTDACTSGYNCLTKDTDTQLCPHHFNKLMRQINSPYRY